MATMRAVLAHQGGWDEIAYFAVPAVLAILALRWAEKRAARRHADEQENEPGADDNTNRRSQP